MYKFPLLFKSDWGFNSHKGYGKTPKSVDSNWISTICVFLPVAGLSKGFCDLNFPNLLANFTSGSRVWALKLKFAGGNIHWISRTYFCFAWCGYQSGSKCRGIFQTHSLHCFWRRGSKKKFLAFLKNKTCPPPF